MKTNNKNNNELINLNSLRLLYNLENSKIKKLLFHH